MIERSFITGLSMGGHGAMYLSAKHPELFSAAGSMSGVADMEISHPILKSESQVNGTRFRSEGNRKEVYASYAVLGMVTKMKTNKLALIIDCGVDDFLIDSNRELHRDWYI
jgi:S-formylglutathione hydrolase FrmB